MSRTHHVFFYLVNSRGGTVFSPPPNVVVLFYPNLATPTIPLQDLFQLQVIPVRDFQTHHTYDGTPRYRTTTLGGGVYCRFFKKVITFCKKIEVISLRVTIKNFKVVFSKSVIRKKKNRFLFMF